MNKIKAFLFGMLEFRSLVTFHVSEDYIEAYDAGRDLAHKLTLRYWDHV